MTLLALAKGGPTPDSKSPGPALVEFQRYRVFFALEFILCDSFAGGFENRLKTKCSVVVVEEHCYSIIFSKSCDLGEFVNGLNFSDLFPPDAFSTAYP